MGTISYLAKMAADREKRAALWDKLFRMGMLTPKSMRRLYRGANVKQLEVPKDNLLNYYTDLSPKIRESLTNNILDKGTLNSAARMWPRLTGKPLSRVKNKDLVAGVDKHLMEDSFERSHRLRRDYAPNSREGVLVKDQSRGQWIWDAIRKGLRPAPTASNPMQAGRFLKLQQGKTQAAKNVSLKASRAAEAAKNKATKATRMTPQTSRKSEFKQE